MDQALDAPPASPIPDDDPRRALAHLPPADDDSLRHLAIAGGIYTILLGGPETAGRFSLIEMRVPPGGGPPPHRHDFEETFRVLEGEAEFTFRGESVLVRAGETVHIPANAPHHFRNTSATPARLLSISAPAAQDEFFLAVADPVPTAAAPAPALTEAERAQRGARAHALAARYRTEFV